MAEGQYIAYCGQDDIWLPEKLFFLEQQMVEDSAILICSNVFVIEGTGKRIELFIAAQMP